MDSKSEKYRQFAIIDAWYERKCLSYFGEKPLEGQRLEDLAERWALRHYGSYLGFDRNPVMEGYRRIFKETYRSNQ